MDKRMLYLILQITIIIGALLFSYYFVFNEQWIKVLLFFVMVTSIILLGYYFNKKFKREREM
ncbi:MAG: hypothetical protein LPK00_11895 [Bacillaceae bacterium]|nr:hypothetical protein [Bacillaceae bacterium]